MVQDAQSYQAMMERLEEVDAIEGIKHGLEQMERGEGIPAAEVFAAFRGRHGIQHV